MMQEEFELGVGYRVNDKIYEEIEFVYMNSDRFQTKQEIIEFWKEHDYCGIHSIYMEIVKANRHKLCEAYDLIQDAIVQIKGMQGVNLKQYLDQLDVIENGLDALCDLDLRNSDRMNVHFEREAIAMREVA